MGKIVVGNNQNIILTTGQVLKSKNLKVGDIVIGFNEETKKLSENKVTSVSKSDKVVTLFSSSQGRIILCPIDTKFHGSEKSDYGFTCFKEKFDNYDRRNYVKCLLNHPIFGDTELDDKDIEALRSSIFYLNDKRPNHTASLVQSIPKLLTTLTKDSLEKVLNGVDFVRNLDIYSKDLLIVLIGRLGLYFNGNSGGAGSKDISGSLEILYGCTACTGPETGTSQIKIEKLTPLGESDMDSLELTFESPAVFIGSLLCQTN